MTEYIRREDLMERVGRWQLNTREAIAEMIVSVPSADVVERKTGEWVKNEGRAGWHCSNCGVDNNYAYSWNSDTGRNEFQDNFCPNCGADMRGREDERTD